MADLSYGIEEQAATISGLVAAWHDFGYSDPPSPDCKTIPPLGERSAEAVKACREVIAGIDTLTRRLAALRDQLTSELQQDEEARGHRNGPANPLGETWKSPARP